MGHAARTDKREMNTKYLLGNIKRRDHLGKLEEEGRILLKWDFNRVKCVEWIERAQCRIQERVFANRIMNLLVYYKINIRPKPHFTLLLSECLILWEGAYLI